MKRWFYKTLIVTNIILYLAIIAIWISIPEELTLNISSSIVALTMTIILIMVSPKPFKELVSSRYFSKLSQSLISSFLFFLILALINFISFKFPLNIDFSLQKLNSLSSKSINIIKNTKGSIIFKVFAQKNAGIQIISLLKLYKYHRPEIKINFIDIDLNPVIVKQNNIVNDNTVIIEYQNRKKRFVIKDELSVTNAILSISQNKVYNALYTTGHGEIDFNNKSQHGGSFAKKTLNENLVTLRPISLLSNSKIPHNTNLLFIIGPKKEFQKNEINKISTFMKKGGSLIIALDPDVNGTSNRGLRKMLKDIGLNIYNDMVIDLQNHVNGSKGSVPIVSAFNNNHIITKNFRGTVFFPLASSISKYNLQHEKGIFTPLALSSTFPSSWAERNLNEIIESNVSYNDNIDIKGPAILAATWEEVTEAQTDKKNRSKIVAFGNSTFILNTYKNYSSNILFFSNTVSWAVETPGLISLDTPTIKNEKLFISAPQIGIIFYFSVLFAPLILSITSFIAYRRRVTG